MSVGSIRFVLNLLLILKSFWNYNKYIRFFYCQIMYIKKQKAWSFIFQIIFLTIFWFLINIHIFMAWIMTELLLIFSQNVDIIGCQMKWCLTFHLNWIVERKVYFCLRVCDIHERTKIMVVHFKTRWYRFDFWNLETEKKKSNPYSSRHKIIFCWTSQINVGIVTLWN